MITHGFTNLAMTKSSPSPSCNETDLLTTGATSTAPHAYSPARVGGNSTPTSSSPEMSHGQRAIAPLKAASMSPRPSFRHHCRHHGLRAVRHLTLQAGHSRAAHLDPPPPRKTPTKQTLPIPTPPTFFLKYAINHAGNLTGREVWGLCSRL